MQVFCRRRGKQVRWTRAQERPLEWTTDKRIKIFFAFHRQSNCRVSIGRRLSKYPRLKCPMVLSNLTLSHPEKFKLKHFLFILNNNSELTNSY